MIGPIPAAVDALAVYLAGSMQPDVEVVRGWVERNKRIGLADNSEQGRAVVACLTIEGLLLPLYPYLLGKVIDPYDNIEKNAYRVGECVITGNLDLWATHRGVRDRVAFSLQQIIAGTKYSSSSLELVSNGYFDRPLRFHFESSEIADNTDKTSRAEWRQIWPFTCQTDLIVLSDEPDLVEAIVDHNIQ